MKRIKTLGVYNLIKRIVDIIGAIIGLLILCPLIILISALIYYNLGAPIFFHQLRPGRGGKPFLLTKFRTMSICENQNGDLLPDKHRITRFGKFLRSTSIDELPELLNVLKGEMSLVGPRPLLMDYLPLYTPRQARRHSVRPGITGWAQINGRNAISWEEKFELDVWYVNNRSFWLDIKIIWLTILKVIKREGITAAGEATMSKFTGGKS